jgi:hypothetical protein
LSIAVMKLLTGLELLDAVRALNALLYGAAVLLTGYLAAEHLDDDPLLRIFGLVLTTASFSLLKIFAMAWSEPLFIVLSLLFLIVLGTGSRMEGFKAILALGTIGGLATLTRYSGIALLFLGAIVVFRRGSAQLWSRTAQVLVYAAIASSPFLVWLARNHQLTGTATGSRTAFAMTLGTAISTTSFVLVVWFLPLVAGVAAVSVLAARSSTNLVVWWRSVQRYMQSSAYLLLFVAVYLVFLVTTGLWGGLTYIDDKYLAPIYIPALLILLRFLLVQTVLLTGRPARRPRQLLVLVTLSIPVLYSLISVRLPLSQWSRYGVDGYTSKSWLESPTIEHLEHNPTLFSGLVYSNAPDAVHFLLNRRTEYVPNREDATLSGLEAAWPRERAYVIQFEMVDRSYLYTIDELEEVSTVTLVREFDDGVLYEVRKAH